MKPLSKQQIISVIERTGCADRIPMTYNFWIAPISFGEQKNEILNLFEEYPGDVEIITLNMPDLEEAPPNAPHYRWAYKDLPKQTTSAAIDSHIVLEDWSELDALLANFPDPNYIDLIPQVSQNNDQYRLVCWWYCFFERFWSLRGMENALTDFYLYPEETHRLFDHLTNFYIRIMERAKYELNADGMFTSDDIGTQTGPFFSLEIFNEFFKPYYKRIIDKAHELGMHFWLHTCGNIELFLPEFIDIKLDVIHPIQKYTMDEVNIASKYGKDICIWAGFDVQQTIPYQTPEDVRKEVRYLIDTYATKEGGLILTMGNGSTPDWKVESISALYDETLTYGTHKIQQLKTKGLSHN